MPKRLIIIGIVFCLAGMMAIWEIIAAAFRDHIHINLAVFMLPVGIGLLRGRPRSRWWAGFWIIISYVACAVLIGAAIFFPGDVYASWFDTTIAGRRAVPCVLGGSLALAVLLALMHRALYSSRVSGYLYR